jgi:hypothetical protein
VKEPATKKWLPTAKPPTSKLNPTYSFIKPRPLTRGVFVGLKGAGKLGVGAAFGLPKLPALQNAATKIPKGLAGLSDDAARLSHNAARQSDELAELAVKNGRTRIAAPRSAASTPTTNPNASRFYEVGLAKDLRKNPVTGTQVNHAPQSRQAESLIGDFNLRNKVGNEPSIRLPIEEHNAVSAAQRARTAPASARDLLADEIRILRQNTNAPNSALQDLIRLSRETHPWDYLPLHRMELP